MVDNELQEMVKGFEEIAEMVKNGTLTMEDLENIIKETRETLDLSLELVRKVVKDLPDDRLTELQRVAIKAQIEESFIDFEYKKQKRTVISTLKVVDAVDKDIGANVFLPFILGAFEKSVDVFEDINEDMAKAIRKGVKKFKKNKEA